jgi:hypothetical protein
VGGYKVDDRNLEWLIGINGKLDSYSKLTSLLSHYQGWESGKIDLRDNVQIRFRSVA